MTQTDRSEKAPTDVDVERSVRRQLIVDPAVEADAIDVAVVDGVVTLQGHIPHQFGKRRAIAIAQRQRGVRSVVDQLEVGVVAVPDPKVEADVLHALRVAPEVDASRLDVEVKDGVVRLTGRVGSRAEKDLARDLAYGTPGVREVESAIVIEPVE